MHIEGQGWPFIILTDTGLPSVDIQTLKGLAGDDPDNCKFGKLFEFYSDKGEIQKAVDTSIALYQLIKYR